MAVKFKMIRSGWNLTQEEMAEKIGMSYRYYQKLEGGKYSPRIFTLFKLSKKLKVPMADFFR